ncbi:MAG: glycosyltransferase family 2 protein [Planctomycetes bacterium]|nr:glycosyltransferase family 2 protein [Planctomycetota bacterium]
MSESAHAIPKISVGMPVYNGERFLRQAIDSILGQTFSDFELIISDNASTDSTPEICREYAARDSRIRFVAHAVNKGAAWNHAQVVDMARAEYFTWAHADDFRAPRNLECCVAELDLAPTSVVLALTRGVIIDEQEKQTNMLIPSMDLREAQPARRLKVAFRNAVWCNVIFGLVRTSVLRSCRPLAGYSRADLVLIYELALRGQFREIPENLFYRRWHPPWTEEYAAAYMDPRNTKMPNSIEWQVSVDALRAIRAVKLPWSEAIHCRAVLLRERIPYNWREASHLLKCLARAWWHRVRGRLPGNARANNP